MPSLSFNPLLLACGIAFVNGADHPVTWVIPMPSPQTLSVAVGDTVTFSWSFSHNVYLSASQADYNSCATTGGTMLATTSVNTYQHTFSSAGTFYFICEVSGHCSADQKIAITATAPSPPPAPPTSPAPASPDDDDDGGKALRGLRAFRIVPLLLGIGGLVALIVSIVCCCKRQKVCCFAPPAQAPPPGVQMGRPVATAVPVEKGGGPEI